MIDAGTLRVGVDAEFFDEGATEPRIIKAFRHLEARLYSFMHDCA